MNRGQFVTGLFLAGAGLAEVVVSGWENGNISRQRAEQHTRAYRDVVAKGTPPEPDQQAVTDAQQLRDELKNADPLRPSTPELEEAKRQAGEDLQKQEVFVQAVQQRESELRSREGPSDLEETVSNFVGLKGLATATFGVLKMAKAKSDYDDALYEEELRKRYPSFYPQPKKPE